MSEPKGEKLFVNLGATQTRRRLKGFGRGVRKVHSGGRNQAVIIHTATGRHVEELSALFADVGISSQVSDLARPVANPSAESAVSERGATEW
jgi:DNA transformation protein and related proteins